MNATKISRPFAAAFSTLLNGNAVSITEAEAAELDNTSNAYGDKFRLAIALFNEHVIRCLHWTPERLARVRKLTAIQKRANELAYRRERAAS